MAFTFNWAGVSGIQPITPKDRDQQMRSDAAAYGAALKGYERYQADQEYAKLLEGRNSSVKRVSEIQQEIARLEQRNSFIDQQLAQIAGTAVQPNIVPESGGIGWDINASKANVDY